MGDNIYTVTSPIMGTFYTSASPDEKAYIKEGSEIAANDLVCMIESMKVFTELRSEHNGIVKKILVENEDPVMKNQALIEIEKK